MVGKGECWEKGNIFFSSGEPPCAGRRCTLRALDVNALRATFHRPLGAEGEALGRPALSGVNRIVQIFLSASPSSFEGSR